MESRKVLFLCTSNSALSQMAEEFMRRNGGKAFEVYSAGLDPIGLNLSAAQVMAEMGLDISTQRGKSINAYSRLWHFNYLIILSNHAEEIFPKIFPFEVDHRIHWFIEDPANFRGTEEEKLAKFREVRDLIRLKVREWLIAQDIVIP